MNISSSNIAGDCNNKCSYAYNYPINNTTTASNYGENVSVSYAQAQNSATYNDIGYEVTHFFINSPSMLLYNGTQSSGDIVIFHRPTNGAGTDFFVFIPLSTSGKTNKASNTISEIISAIKSSAPSQGGSVSQGISEFTLNDFIPNNEYFSYEDSGGINIVAFGINDAIHISEGNLTALKSCINTKFNMPSGPTLYLSTSKPKKGDSSGSDIYIDCQPTDASEEEVTVDSNKKTDSTSDNFDANTIMQNPITSMLISAIIFFVFIIGIRFLLSYLGNNTPNKSTEIKMPKLTLPKVSLPKFGTTKANST